MIKLIPEAKRAWRMLSVQAMTAAAALQGAWVAIPDGLRESVPPAYITGITITLLVLGVLGRLVAQPKVSQ